VTKLMFASVLVVSLLFANSVLAQVGTSGSQQKVFLNVAVTNEQDHWVGGLKADDFRIQEKSKPHRIVSSTFANAPASIGLLIDTSGSSTTRMDEILRVVNAFIHAGKEGDEFFLMTFNTTASLILDRSENRSEILRSLASLSKITPKANTRLYDALDVALDKIAGGKHTVKALIVVSDAVDNASKVKFKDIREKLRRSDVLLYNINVIEPIDMRSQHAELSMARMEELADISGGRVLLPKTNIGFEEIASRAAQEIHTLYRLEVEPLTVPVATDKSEWRRVAIEVVPARKDSKLGKLKVRTRDGYYYTVAGQ
jgi:Ca-activated chloride channel homolog